VTTASSITIVWAPSNDDVGVAGYGVYDGVTRLHTTTATSYTLQKLSCGTAYTLVVDAYDAAGNRSATAVLDATTGPCSTPEPQPIAGQGYRLVFGDEFDSFDRSVWDDHLWYDDPPSPAWTNFQYTADGVLHLVTSRNFSCGTDCTYPLNTITTQSSGLTFRRGYFDARIRYTDNNVAWPAFWLLSYAHATNPSYPSLNPSCADNAQPPGECYSAELDVLDNGGAANELSSG